MQKRTLNAKYGKTHQNPRKSREIIHDFSRENPPPQPPPPHQNKPCDKKSPPPNPIDKSIYQIEKSPFEMMNTK